MMKRLTLKGLVLASLLAPPAIVGCDRTVYEERSVKEKSDGTTVTEEKKTTESADGDSRTTTEKKEVDRDR
jgi:hypothetical protein